MARLGMLALQDGCWEGKQVVPAAWVKSMTTGQSTPFFGYYWWVNNNVEGGVEGGSTERSAVADLLVSDKVSKPLE